MKKLKILIINGPNLDILGNRETEIYGNITLKELEKKIKVKFKKNFKFDFYQSNHEGKIIDKINKSKKIHSLIINGGGLSHYSISIMDSIKNLKLNNTIIYNIHLSNILERENFRKQDYIALVADKSYIGEGIKSYFKALEDLIANISSI